MAAGDPSGAMNISHDPRHARLFPTAGEFADPFVENVTILREWNGESQCDQFGWIAGNIGDVDGDGIADAAVSATLNGEGGPSAGKVYLYSGGSGHLIWSKPGEVQPGQLGFGLEAAGDVNADGIPDVVAGAPYVNTVYVFSGGDGTLLHEITGEQDGIAFGTAVGGQSVSGESTFLVGAPRAGNGEFKYTGVLKKSPNLFSTPGLAGSDSEGCSCRWSETSMQTGYRTCTSRIGQMRRSGLRQEGLTSSPDETAKNSSTSVANRRETDSELELLTRAT